ncbi:hemolysin [Candidatus Epulonipiscium fishelsonii]|uniref:Hemolysin n=1 Tax=Candidatus Epulonipiscium fishelsonii TaxID=77094 RepID=A0ACC8X8V6_9FIRM|nr:hemolysin [Epulopiscium sp. SCG-B11WGA-EpuloA1]ONI40555.1 hemolysin [Epulopiscium sp. SCG-B05WGA-EpuloA1]
MGSELGIQIFILILMIGGSAFFSMSETALMSITKIDVRHMISQNVAGAKLLEKLIDDPSKLLGSILIGNNLVNIGASSIATVLATNLFGSAGVGIATGCMTLFILIFGEITPKSLASKNSQKIALLVSKPIFLVVIIVSPIVKILMIVTNALNKLLSRETDNNETFITDDKLKTIVTVSHEEGILEKEEKDMIYNVVDFGELYAKDIMIPRTDMIAVNIKASYGDIISIFKEHQFSRMPVYENYRDNIVGMVYIKDLLMNKVDPDTFVVSSILREAYFVHEYNRIDKLFKELRLKKIGMAFVIDEYGGISGLITMEDLIEEIVGDINDEYDIPNEDFIQVNEYEYLIDGTYRISDVNSKLNLKIISNEFDSIGGYIIGLLDRFPVNGEMVTTDNLIFAIEESDNNRITKLRLTIGDIVNSDECIISQQHI